MNDSILFVAREFTLGGAAWLAVRYLRQWQRLHPSQRLELLITGPVCGEMLAALPANVSVSTIAVPAQLLKRGLLPTRQWLMSADQPVPAA